MKKLIVYIKTNKIKFVIFSFFNDSIIKYRNSEIFNYIID